MTILKTVRAKGALSLMLATVLVGCGGGGGGDSSGSTTPVTPVTPVVPLITEVDIPIQSALSTYVRTDQPIVAGSGTVTVQGVAVPFTLHYKFTPDDPTATSPATTFEGSPVYSAREQLQINRTDNNELMFQSDQRTYFGISPYALLGSRDLFRSTYTTVNRTGTLPSTARIGASGVLGTATTYTDETKAQVQGTPATLVWNMEADGTSTETVLLCLSQTTAGTTGSSYCYRISRAGAVQSLVIRPSISS